MKEKEGYTIFIGGIEEKEERIIACIKACEAFTTEALKSNIVKDLLDQYLDLSDLDELEVLVKQTRGEVQKDIEKRINDTWDFLDAVDFTDLEED